MKKISLFILLILSLQGCSQCSNTFLYGFQLTGISNPKEVTATVYYKGKPIVAKNKTICTRATSIKTKFTYLKNRANKLNETTLPYWLPANRFYWLMTDEMNIEMAVHPNNFKIVLNSNNAQLQQQYELPITYDFVSQNAIYLDLIDKSETNLNNQFNERIWQFSLYKIQNNHWRDTVLEYSVQSKIAEGVLTAFPELKTIKNIHSMQEYTANGMLLNGKLFLKLSETINNQTDKSKGLYVSLDGKKCAMEGGITGTGAGECGKAFLQKTKPIYYKISIQIQP